ncbi:Duffy blood group [Haladaptatus sp. CMAA 1911]|uniref:Duffy blood group n=1 Tax=unclassified Haladaptatus TaxID=2622732 RepID=UPI003754D61C
MPKSETRAFTGVSAYDGPAGLVAFSILAWTFLVEAQPLVGLLLTTAFVSTYAAARFDSLEHAIVFVCLWAVVTAAVLFMGTLLGFAVAAVSAVACYALLRGAW